MHIGEGYETRTSDIWIETFTGKRFDFIYPKLKDINLEDIAHALSMKCRFTGHCLKFYSVAEHSICVAEMVQKIAKEPPTDKTVLAALLHDASEAYMPDVSRPFKTLIPKIEEIEHQLKGLIYQRFGCTGADTTLIKQVDNIMLATEARDLMFSGGVGWNLPEKPAESISITIPMQPHRAKMEFLSQTAYYSRCATGA